MNCIPYFQDTLRFLIVTSALLYCFTGRSNTCEAQTTYGAIGLGVNWANPLSWTPGSGPPGPLDTVWIGSNSPLGATPNASVFLSSAANVAHMSLGRVSGASGSLDLNGQTLNVSGSIELGFGALGVGSIAHNGGTLHTGSMIVRNISNFQYSSGDTSNNLTLQGGGVATTASSTNVGQNVLVNELGSTLHLGADLVLSQDLDIRGSGLQMATVDSHGFNITARDIYVGRFGHHAQILNRGVITATRNLESSGSTFSLNASDIVANQVRANNGGTLNLHANTAAQSASITLASKMKTAASSNLSTFVDVLDASSTLDLGANLVLSEDLRVRGTNAIQAMINANGFDITARDIEVGQFGHHGDIINRGIITATRSLGVSGGTFTLNGSDSVANQVRASNGGTLNLHANTAAKSAAITLASTMNTAATSNFSTFADVLDANSTLNLGANLVLSQNLRVRGIGANLATINANGFDITAQDIDVGQFGSHGNIINRGVITATRHLGVSGGTFSLNASDSVANQVRASNGGTLNLHANTAAQSASLTQAGTLNTTATSNLATFVDVLDTNSTLNLGADLTLSLDLRVRGATVNQATIDANGYDIIARDIDVGQFGHHGNIINRGSLTATRSFGVSGGTFSLMASDSVATQVRASNGGTFSLHTNTAAQSASITLGGTINTAATSNLATFVDVLDANSTINLGADLVLSQDLRVRGATSTQAYVNAAGFDITANRLLLGQFNNSGALQNDGAVTVNQLLSDRSSLNLTGGNDTVQSVLSLLNSSTLTVSQVPGEMSGLTLNGNSLNIDVTSLMVLNFDAQINAGIDWAFRWLNPTGGDRIADLTSLINNGRIAINAPAAASVFDWGNGYTYIGYVTATQPATRRPPGLNPAPFASYIGYVAVPEPATFSLILLALGANLLRRGRRM